MTDARRFSRLPFASVSRLVDPASGEHFGARLVDISLKGALVELARGALPEIGDTVRLEVRLEDSPVTIDMEATVAHLNGQRAGLYCRSIDVESMTHLRRLMELNLGDASLLERELLALG